VRRFARLLGATFAATFTLALGLTTVATHDARPVHADGPALTLVAQSAVGVAPGTTVTFTVAMPTGVDLAALGDPGAPVATVGVTAWKAIDANKTEDTREKMNDAIAGKLGAAVGATSLPLAALASPTAGQLQIPVTIDGDASAAAPLKVGKDGIYPVTIELRSGGLPVARVITFVARAATDASPAAAEPLAVALAVGTDAAVHLDDAGRVAIDSATIGQLTTLARILETSAMPATVHVAPQLLAALRRTDAPLADRFAAVLDTATILSAPALPLDPSAAVAAGETGLYTQWLAEGEDLFGSADLPGTTLRAAAALTTPLSEPGGELLRDLGTRLLLLTPALYDQLDGSLKAFTDTSQLVQVHLDDDRTFDAAVVDRTIGERLMSASPVPFLNAVYTTVDLLADRRDILNRGGNPRRHTVLIGTNDLGLPDPATLAPITQLISTTPGLSVSAVSQLSGTTDTMIHDGEEVTVNLPSATSATIAPRIKIQSDLRAAGAQAASMLVDTDARPATWAAQMDTLPSTAVSDEQAVAIQTSLLAQFDAIRSSVVLPQGLDFTLTGRTGTIRLKFHNSAAFAVQIKITLGAASNKLSFDLDKSYLLPANADREIQVKIESRSNGRFPVYLNVYAPVGNDPLVPARKFTANVLALSGLGNLVTGAALLVLLTWWIHHIRSGRRRKATDAALGRHPVSVAGAGGADLSPDAATSTLPDS
jgi:hypothetical protein